MYLMGVWWGKYSVSCGKNPQSVPAALPQGEMTFNSDVISVFIFGSKVNKAARLIIWKSGNERYRAA